LIYSSAKRVVARPRRPRQGAARRRRMRVAGNLPSALVIAFIRP
jgi:hypothetical protein